MVKKYLISDCFGFLDGLFFQFFDNSVLAFLYYLVKKESVILRSLSCSNPYFLYKSISINIAKKWKEWYIKTDSKLLTG